MTLRMVAILLPIAIFSCGLPKDPHGSWDKAKKEGLRVGLVQNPPFSSFENGKYKGREVELLNGFAKRENLRIFYETGNETGLMESLENFEVHVVIGGFDKNTVWKKKAGLTTEYNGKNIFLVPKGENRLLLQLESYFLNEN